MDNNTVKLPPNTVSAPKAWGGAGMDVGRVTRNNRAKILSYQNSQLLSLKYYRLHL